MFELQVYVHAIMIFVFYLAINQCYFSQWFQA